MAFWVVSMTLSISAQSEYITPLDGPGVEIIKVFIHKSGAVSLYISGAVVNLDRCTATSRIYIPHDLAGKDAMLSTALMAFASDNKIEAHGSGCSATVFRGGRTDVPIVDNLWVL